MSPSVELGDGGTVKVMGPLSVKREYGLKDNRVYPVISDEAAAAELVKHQGQIINSITSDENGPVFERATGRSFYDGESFTPPQGQNFILATVELEPANG